MTIQSIKRDKKKGTTVIQTRCGNVIPLPTFKVPAGLQSGHRVERDIQGGCWAFFDDYNRLVCMIKTETGPANRT